VITVVETERNIALKWRRRL